MSVDLGTTRETAVQRQSRVIGGVAHFRCGVGVDPKMTGLPSPLLELIWIVFPPGDERARPLATGNPFFNG